MIVARLHYWFVLKLFFLLLGSTKVVVKNILLALSDCSPSFMCSVSIICKMNISCSSVLQSNRTDRIRAVFL